MKKIFLAVLSALVIVLPTTTVADSLTGRSLMFEYVLGVGDSNKTHGFMIRARDDHVEGHVGAWFGKDRTNGVIGLGYVAEGEEGDFNASVTGGGAVVFKKRDNYSRNFVTFVRGAFGYQPTGAGEGNASYEVSVSRYGLFGQMNDSGKGDTFLGFGYRRLETTDDPTAVATSEEPVEEEEEQVEDECYYVDYGEGEGELVCHGEN